MGSPTHITLLCTEDLTIYACVSFTCPSALHTLILDLHSFGCCPSRKALHAMPSC